MAIINTPLTKLLNVQLPIISAPMAFAATANLASAVTQAGGFGFMGAGFYSSQELKRNLQEARTLLSINPGDPVPIGIGLIGWILDKTEISDDPRIEAILEEKPVALWFAFGDDLGKYIAQVRAYDSKREDGHKTIVFVMVGTVEDALVAANEWKVDVVVAQGIEAGGHGRADAPPLLTLLQAVLTAVPSGPDSPSIIAAGGVSAGAQVAALLTAGAHGVVLGTRFLFTNECIYSSAHKDALLKAGLINSTRRTLAFDEVGRTMGWPEKHDGRALVNDIITDVDEGLGFEDRLRRYDESKEKGETSRLIVWAGAGVGLSASIVPAEDVVHELRAECVGALQRASGLLG
ncbi:hypothetical protein VNI00_012541 [Paramarasmius palmivorus]|uniref:2-nitropropane dioxygenase n=1 Tax=Paramarasmius palmivorus TaxID=297713 RepID=A0AAW0C5X9_9AGAR